ncbi:MAG: roadblock/LC7 domain-containing protein [Deltaproteobacteria bacterium]|nr:roadblock/LC7 domain-containing protein [Deltaproteobacteria bacterium]
MVSMPVLTQTLTRGNPDVLGLLVVDSDGQVHASESVSDDIVRAAVAITVPLRDLLDRAATELGCGELRATVVEGRDACLAIADVDGFRTVVVIGSTTAAAGSLRADSLWVAERLRRDAGEPS